MALWEAGEPYKENGQDKHWVFDVRPHNGKLHSEDTTAAEILARAGFQSFLAPHMCCAHIGPKVWRGDFRNWLKAFNEQRMKRDAV